MNCTRDDMSPYLLVHEPMFASDRQAGVAGKWGTWLLHGYPREQRICVCLWI